MIASNLATMEPRRRQDAFALVLVIVLLSLMTIIAVGYLSSMSSERATAAAFSSKTRAEEASQAAVDTAEGTLRDYFKAFPDSATAWDTNQITNPSATPSNAAPNPTPTYSGGTTLYLRAVPQANSPNLPDPAPGISSSNYSSGADYIGGNGPNNGTKDSTTGAPQVADARKTFVLPLVSGATVNLLANKASIVTTSTNAVNLNNRRNITDTQGWLGSPSGNGSLPKPVYVPWVEVAQKDGSNGIDPAPVVARYAYWVEDESFRTNISYAGQGQTPSGGTPTHQRSDNTANYLVDPTYADLLGLLNFVGDAAPTTTSQNLVNTRNVYPTKLFPEASAFTHANGLSTATTNSLRYISTSQSASLNLTRHGTQRVNLNDIVYPPSGATYGDAQSQIYKIYQAILFHAPNFGQRFYRRSWSGHPAVPTSLNSLDVLNGVSTPATPHATIYMYRTAANIRDYIDADVLPTVLDAPAAVGGKPTIHQGTKPTQAMNYQDGANPYWAVGKDAAPVLQEAAVHFSGSANATTYTVNVDYYIELWNMSTQPITGSDLGPGAFVRVSNPTKWFADNKSNAAATQVSLSGDGHTLSDTRDVIPPGRDFDIDISAVTFPPGVATVITTDPNWSTIAASISDATNANNQMEAAKHFVLCPFISPGKRTYTGTFPTGCNEVRMLYSNSTSSDYETAVIVGNSKGYIDSLEGAISMTGGIVSMPVGSSPRTVYGGYLRGNLASGTAPDGSTGGGLQPSCIGDPRSNNEQLNYTLHGGSADDTGYKNYDLSNSNSQIPSTFGLPNIYSVGPAKALNPWPDYYWYPGSSQSSGAGSTAVMTARNAPAFYANAPLRSIGQLGDIYDPARLPGTNGGDVTASRGGGRTFKLGQHDDLYDPAIPSTGYYAASSGWASWRLADIFTVSNAMEQPGLININGLARDGGAALMAAFQGFKFQPQVPDAGTAGSDPSVVHGDVQLAGKSFDATGLQNLINDLLKSRPLTPIDPTTGQYDPTKIHPFFERGEISETPILKMVTGSTPLVNGVNMSTVFDSGREELVRRLIGMTTTRGNVFTVYALGQAISQPNPKDANTKRVTATHQLRVTFKLTPKNSDGSAFHPATDVNGNPVDFNPDPTSSQFASRFLKPDHYDIEVLSASSGNS